MRGSGAGGVARAFPCVIKPTPTSAPPSGSVREPLWTLRLRTKFACRWETDGQCWILWQIPARSGFRAESSNSQRGLFRGRDLAQGGGRA